jgi:drug/metabolite transporter (DMT)-like permease
MGLALAIFSCVFATAKDLVSKRLAGQLDGTVSTFASFAFAVPYYVLVLGVLYLFGQEPFAITRAFLLLELLRSITDTFAEWMKMYAFAYGDISVVSSFFSLSPLFLLFLSPFITEDEPSLTAGLGVLVVVAGSLLVVRRQPAKEAVSQRKGILLALGAALFFSLNSCFDRLAMKEGKPLVAASSEALLWAPVFAGFTMTVLSALFLLPLILLRRDRVQTLVAYRGEFALRGFLEITFMVSKLTAMQFLSAPEVVAIQRLSLLLAIVAGRVIFKEPDFGRRLAAGMLILTGVCLIALARQ